MSILDEIAQIVGPENVFGDRVECLCYSRDMSVHEGVADAVIFVRSTDQVSAIMSQGNLSCRARRKRNS